MGKRRAKSLLSSVPKDIWQEFKSSNNGRNDIPTTTSTNGATKSHTLTTLETELVAAVPRYNDESKVPEKLKKCAYLVKLSY